MQHGEVQVRRPVLSQGQAGLFLFDLSRLGKCVNRFLHTMEGESIDTVFHDD
jgi:hypothetical protein